MKKFLQITLFTFILLATMIGVNAETKFFEYSTDNNIYTMTLNANETGIPAGASASAYFTDSTIDKESIQVSINNIPLEELPSDIITRIENDTVHFYLMLRSDDIYTISFIANPNKECGDFSVLFMSKMQTDGNEPQARETKDLIEWNVNCEVPGVDEDVKEELPSVDEELPKEDFEETPVKPDLDDVVEIETPTIDNDVPAVEIEQAPIEEETPIVDGDTEIIEIEVVETVETIQEVEAVSSISKEVLPATGIANNSMGYVIAAMGIVLKSLKKKN